MHKSKCRSFIKQAAFLKHITFVKTNVAMLVTICAYFFSCIVQGVFVSKHDSF